MEKSKGRTVETKIEITEHRIVPGTNIRQYLCDWKPCSNRTKISKDVNKIVNAIPGHLLTIASIDITDAKPKRYAVKLSGKSVEPDISGFNSLAGEAIARFKALFNIDFMTICASEQDALIIFLITYK